MLYAVLFLVTCLTAIVQSAPAAQKRQAQSLYAPVNSSCPITPLVRPAKGISSKETVYFISRKALADLSLQKWLKTTSLNCKASKLPSIGLTTSGGGYRSLLEGAGVVQAFDSRDSNTSTSGIFQGLTYHAGLSGGAFLVSSLAGNNWPTVSSLVSGLWSEEFEDTIFLPGGAENAAIDDAAIANDLLAKEEAGFPPVLTDPWGRLFSYQLLYGPDGGAATRLSGIAANSKFVAAAVPYPILTALELPTGQCLPADTSTQFELHPFEFGSWDSGVTAFAQTAYLGTKMNNGAPVARNQCIQNFDNLGYALGTSSTFFGEICDPELASNSSTELIEVLEELLETDELDVERDEYAVYPNPFYGYSSSPGVKTETELHLVDGGTSNQNNPIWPFIQPARSGVIDVLIVNDNSADTDDNFPNGTEIYHTYLQAQRLGLTRMPTIPPTDTFVSEGLNKRAAFFGCSDKTKLTIIYLPNVNYTYPSNQPTAKFQYAPNETAGMIANGNLIATQNGQAGWPLCLACGIMHKSLSPLPKECNDCLTKYCWTH
jgi:lysophospholipase